MYCSSTAYAELLDYLSGRPIPDSLPSCAGTFQHREAVDDAKNMPAGHFIVMGEPSIQLEDLIDYLCFDELEALFDDAARFFERFEKVQ